MHITGGIHKDASIKAFDHNKKEKEGRHFFFII